MNQAEYSQYLGGLLDACHKLRSSKGQEYARDDDQLANFKRLGADLSLHPAQVALVYFTKHLDSIKSYIKARGQGKWPESSEPIQGRIQDAVNYLFLLGAILEEEMPKEEAGLKAFANSYRLTCKACDRGFLSHDSNTSLCPACGPQFGGVLGNAPR